MQLHVNHTYMTEDGGRVTITQLDKKYAPYVYLGSDGCRYTPQGLSETGKWYDNLVEYPEEELD